MDVHLTSYIRLCVSTRIQFPKLASEPAFLKAGKGLPSQANQGTKKGFPAAMVWRKRINKARHLFSALIAWANFVIAASQDRLLYELLTACMVGRTTTSC